MEETKNSPRVIALPLVLCLGIAAGLFLGMNMKGGNMAVTTSGKEYQKLKEVLGLIDAEYVDEAKTSELVEDAIEHILGKLDPHSTYFSALDKVEANESLQGNYEGIGIEFSIFHDTLVVVAPLSGGPSEAVGLHSGDRIIKVDDKNITGIGLRNSDVYKLLKGPKGSKVNIETLRGSATMKFTIIRDKIPQSAIDAAYMIDDKTGYIKVNQFAINSYDEFKVELMKLKGEGMERLIVDLQGNPGGFMHTATAMADEFLPTGKKIVYTKGQDTRLDQEFNSTDEGGFETGALIVLINEGSASASEILAGALQDNDRALIVGRRSFGKGLVQRPFDLSDGSELRLTISRYYTPSGRSIQKPYDDGENYSKDIALRFSKGEFFHADSIKFNDSLRYRTENGRSVYGGGGIMPDYFVPLDTTGGSQYLNHLYTSNSIQEYSFQYVEKNKEKLESMGEKDFLSNFEVTDAMLSDLTKIGERNQVKANQKDLQMNKSVFQVHVKAMIARKVWKNDGYFRVMNQTNEILQQAIKLFDRIQELDRGKM